MAYNIFNIKPKKIGQFFTNSPTDDMVKSIAADPVADPIAEPMADPTIDHPQISDPQISDPSESPFSGSPQDTITDVMPIHSLANRTHNSSGQTSILLKETEDTVYSFIFILLLLLFIIVGGSILFGYIYRDSFIVNPTQYPVQNLVSQTQDNESEIEEEIGG
jgi:hypothetical protein